MLFKKKEEKGLILLELVVALGIFLAVMTIGMGTVLAMYGLNKKGQALKLVMTNLNFAVESMAREIVVGTDYQCTDNEVGSIQRVDCLTGGSHITFCSSDGEPISYRYNDNKIDRRIGQINSGETCAVEEFINWDSWQSITAPEVEIENLKFFVTGATVSSQDECKKQPRVTILIEGVAGLQEEERSEFSIQTTASQRAPKIDTSCDYN